MSRLEKAAEAEDATNLNFGDVFGAKDAIPLMISEVQFLLEARQAMNAKKEDEEGTELEMQEAFQKTLTYAQRFGQFGNKEKVKEVRKLLQKEDLQLHKFEQAALANLCPENTDEAKTLIPSLGLPGGSADGEWQRELEVDETELDETIENLQAYRKISST